MNKCFILMNGFDIDDKAFIDGVFSKYEDAYNAFLSILYAKYDNIDNYILEFITPKYIVFVNSYKYKYWIKEFEIF